MQSISELRERYLRLRQVSSRLNNTMVERFSKADIEQGAKELGMLRDGNMVLNSMDESAVLFDYCIHNLYRDGKNAVKRYVEETAPAEGSEERLVLEAMCRAWYSIFGLNKVVPGLGVEAEDILRRTTHLIADIGLSRTGGAGGMMATRVIPFDGFVITGGAGLPLQGGDREREAFLGAVRQACFEQNIVSFTGLNRDQEKGFTRAIIRAARAGGAASFIRYEDPKPAGAGQARRRQPALVAGRSLSAATSAARAAVGKSSSSAAGATGNRHEPTASCFVTFPQSSPPAHNASSRPVRPPRPRAPPCKLALIDYADHCITTSCAVFRVCKRARQVCKLASSPSPVAPVQQLAMCRASRVDNCLQTGHRDSHVFLMRKRPESESFLRWEQMLGAGTKGGRTCPVSFALGFWPSCVRCLWGSPPLQTPHRTAFGGVLLMPRGPAGITTTATGTDTTTIIANPDPACGFALAGRLRARSCGSLDLVA